MKLSVVMPVYNEVNTILEVLRRVKKVPIEKEIIVVDDCSTDGTREILKEVKDDTIRVIYNDKNMGKGFVIRKGFEYITGDIVIIQDADLEYYPDEYPLLIQKIVERKADVVYGSRFLGARRVFHFSHYLGNQALNLLGNILYDTNLTDLMTGYKAFRASAIKKLRLRADGFGIEAEITAQVFKRRLKVYEVPISYDGRDYEEGKKISWLDFFRSLYWLIRCRFEIYDMGEDTLYRMRAMKNNNKWTFKEIEPYLGNKILEIGAGIGNISKFLVRLNKHIVLTDINEDYLEYLRHRFIANPSVKIVSYDVSLKAPSDILSSGINTVICINVLEHIENDGRALGNIYEILCKDGRLILIVPALKLLYGTMDKRLGHYRRYNKGELIRQLQSNGFTIEKTYYHNLVSAIGWFINSRIFKNSRISSLQVNLVDRLIPIFSKIERAIKVPFGLSLVVICNKK